MAKKVLNQSDLRQMMQKLKADKGLPTTTTDSRLKKYKLSNKELALIESEKKRKAEQDLNEKKKFAKKAGVPENFFDSAKTKAFLNLQKEPQKSILKKGASPQPQVPKSSASSKASGSEWTSSAPVLAKDFTPKEKSPKQKSPKIKKSSPRPGLLRTPSGGAIGHDSEEDEGANDVEEGEAGSVPEGFFDDPVQDAKVRGLEYKDPEEEEWANWTKEIAVELTQSADILAEDQLGETVERQIEEIDEQMRAWTRVIEIEKKKDFVDEQVKSKKDHPGKEDGTGGESDEELNEDELDDLFDWRKKKT